MKQNRKTKQDAKDLDLDALKSNIDAKDWAGAEQSHKKILQSVTYELSRLEFPCIDPKISMLRQDDSRYRLGIQGWNKEVDAMKLRVRFIDQRTRRKGMRCIETMQMNPHSSILHVNINTNLLAGGMKSSQMMRRKRTTTYYAGEQARSRKRHIKTAKLREDIDMRCVKESHIASIKEVLVGLQCYLNSSPKSPSPMITAPKTQSYYKIIIKGVDDELDVLDMTTRMLGDRRDRDPHFGLVTTAGMDPRIGAFVVRVAKLKPVGNKRNKQSRYSGQRKRTETY